MSDFNYDPTEANELSNQWQDASNGLWDAYIDFSHMGDAEWLQGDPELATQFYQMSEQAEFLSNEAYDASWEAYYGPVNAEGYTALDASHGYTSTDTSFIEPASSAGSMSMIADYSTDSNL